MGPGGTFDLAPSAINVILVGGDVLLREGLRRLLLSGPIHVQEAYPDLDALTSASMPADTKCVILLQRPPEVDLGDVVAQLRAVLPELRIVLLEPEKGTEAAVTALRAGIDGYFHLGISAEALVYAIVTAVMGEPIVATRMIDRLLPDNGRSTAGRSRGAAAVNLTERERAILDCLVRGDPNKEIGRRFGVSEASVKRQVRALLQKIGVSNRTQAAVWAMEQTDHR